VKTQASAACVEYFERFARHESQIMLRAWWFDARPHRS
jgi:hypothetical protein